MDEYFDAARLPSTATPRAAPSSREASFMAEPAPARRVGTDDMMAAVIGDMASDMPAAMRRDADQHVEVGRVHAEAPEHEQARPRCSTMPAATTRLEPNRALNRGVIGATTIMMGASGSSRTAADSGE